MARYKGTVARQLDTWALWPGDPGLLAPSPPSLLAGYRADDPILLR